MCGIHICHPTRWICYKIWYTLTLKWNKSSAKLFQKPKTFIIERILTWNGSFYLPLCVHCHVNQRMRKNHKEAFMLKWFPNPSHPRKLHDLAWNLPDFIQLIMTFHCSFPFLAVNKNIISKEEFLKGQIIGFLDAADSVCLPGFIFEWKDLASHKDFFCKHIPEVKSPAHWY